MSDRLSIWRLKTEHSLGFDAKAAARDSSANSAAAPASANRSSEQPATSPGWTQYGGMEAQQHSANRWHQAANARYDSHNAAIRTPAPNRAALKDMEPAHADAERKARDLQRARELLEPARALQQEREHQRGFSMER